MALITLPAKFGFTRVNSFKLQRATNILRSKFTGQAQRIVYPYAVWTLDATLVEYDGVDAGAIRSFLALLEGQKNTFKLPVPGRGLLPLSGYTDNAPVTVSAAARATSLTISGTASVPVVKEGDYFMIADELKISTSNVSFSGAGEATISFQPPLRKPVTGGIGLVILINPTVLLTAAGDDVADWGIAPPIRQSLRFSAIEAVEI